ncbi:chromate transporter [Bacillus sp. B1-b2]|uniref:chromate transporter n=1 Tax=Bacillus sp. B1-b2 TaxID=2653201 RepID=UPI00126220C3|nr:chromate transporter [Bacillus sp. B1-b2]KAB7668403.1 chromate transporter [Bacillus sp. B1-b2]
MKEKVSLLEIFWVFFRMSPITFGGGYAMIPIIEREIVFRKKWMKMQEVSDTLALAGTAPGAIAINASIYIGYRIRGILGALIAMFGALIPTFIIVVTLGSLYLYFQDNTYVNAAFKGISGAVVALITYAAFKISKTSIIDKSTAILSMIMVLGMIILKLHPILVIVLGAILGILITKIKEKLGIVVQFEKEEQQTNASQTDQAS